MPTPSLQPDNTWPRGPCGLGSHRHGLPPLLPKSPSHQTQDPCSPGAVLSAAPLGHVVQLWLSPSPRGCRGSSAMSAGADCGGGLWHHIYSVLSAHLPSRPILRADEAAVDLPSTARGGSRRGSSVSLPRARPPAHWAPGDRPTVCPQPGQAAGRETGSHPT